MSIHRSLKTKPSALNQHRNVLTRNERIIKLMEKDKFKLGDSPMGLPKVISRKPAAAKKKKAEDEEETAEATA